MGYGKIFDVVDKLLERFLPKKEESLRNKIRKLKRERDAILKQKQSERNSRDLYNVLGRLRDAEEALQSRA